MKNDKVIVTSVIGNVFEKVWEITGPTIERYADKVDADLFIIKECPYNTSPHWSKFVLHDLLHKKYSRALWLDSDIVIREDAPDIFQLVPENCLGIFNEGAFVSRTAALLEAMLVYRVELPKWDKTTYYNTGVIVVGREHRHLFRPANVVNHPLSFGEQTFLNLRIQESGVNVYELPYTFNRMGIMDHITGVDRLCSWFVHYAGMSRGKIATEALNDLREWETSDWWKNPVQIIHVVVGGGIGDQVCAEPFVRYLRAVLYPTARIYLSSNYPELFHHIEGIEILTGGCTPPYRAVHVIRTHPDKDSLYAQLSLYTNSHPTDYMSVVSLRRILPEEYRRVTLRITEDWYREVNDICECPSELILVHPGVGWKSKTFPAEWWQRVVDGVAGGGVRVGIIGRNLTAAGITPNETHSVSDIRVPKNGVDFRDRLSTGGLAALLQFAPILITNDSGPLHVAGAFDNWIILIPTCKHPDYILPYRNGGRYYRASVLCSKKMYEQFVFKPTDTSPVNISTPPEPITEYLPEPDEVVQEALLSWYKMRQNYILYQGTMKGESYEYHVV